ncbi:hypothetical protein OC846_003026 [Tilletia horrida]|uniref:Uncharacterized protein n=1 Tax=Tilletia horrida TaxID=155126 RepID=A0AAN6GQV7_9BASI|nr:hypothetical protein OC846_003026 [Tilletia horrida]KAK0566788.1 hypothetical protein OC861_003067 [Tilletia horrida]
MSEAQVNNTLPGGSTTVQKTSWLELLPLRSHLLIAACPLLCLFEIPTIVFTSTEATPKTRTVVWIIVQGLLVYTSMMGSVVLAQRRRRLFRLYTLVMRRFCVPVSVLLGALEVQTRITFYSNGCRAQSGVKGTISTDTNNVVGSVASQCPPGAGLAIFGIFLVFLASSIVQVALCLDFDIQARALEATLANAEDAPEEHVPLQSTAY